MVHLSGSFDVVVQQTLPQLSRANFHLAALQRLSMQNRANKAIFHPVS
jgi:hypothetical protein